MDKLYTVPELLAYFQITKPTLYDWMNNCGLKMTKIRGRTYVKESDLNKFVEKEGNILTDTISQS